MGTTQSTKTKIGFGYYRMTYKLLKPIDQMLKELARKYRMTPIQQLDDLIESEYKSKFRKWYYEAKKEVIQRVYQGSGL